MEVSRTQQQLTRIRKEKGHWLEKSGEWHELLGSQHMRKEMLNLTSDQRTETKQDALSQPPDYQPWKTSCSQAVTMTRRARALRTAGRTPAKAAQEGQMFFPGKLLSG